MVRPALFCLRYIIKIRSFTRWLWDWSATWKWFDWFLVGVFAVSLAIHEYLLAIGGLSLCAFSCISKVWHLPRGIARSLAATVGIFLALSFLIYVTVQEKETHEWSWLLPPLRGLVDSYQKSTITISWANNPAHIDFPPTTFPVPLETVRNPPKDDNKFGSVAVIKPEHGGRHLTNEQKIGLQKLGSQIPNGIGILFVFWAASSEAQIYGKEICHALINSCVNGGYLVKANVTVPPTQGMVIVTKHGDGNDPAFTTASQLQIGMLQLGIPVTWGQGDSLQEHQIVINVGIKPPYD
jgi:drug/metabolite transporter superfamily protein YnfA